MASVKLMNRTDTKFVCNTVQLEDLLALAAEDYLVQKTESECRRKYTTEYLDTPDLTMYHEHQRGRKDRYKIRIRTYVQSGVSFLEVKHKNNHGRTRKNRQVWEAVPVKEKRSAQEFISQCAPYPWEELTPSLNTTFYRITLVNKARTERLTIDLDLEVSNPRTGLEARFPELAIIELKRDGMAPSPMLELLRQLRIKPAKFSKYCIGMAVTSPDLKQNRFKERIRHVRKFTEIEQNQKQNIQQ